MSSHVVLFSPVRCTASVFEPCVRAFCALRGVAEVRLADDNLDARSSLLCSSLADSYVKVPLHGWEPEYKADEETHTWPVESVGRVAALKDQAIEWFLRERPEATHLFLIDADVCPPPELVNVLLDQNKPIVSEIFWTRWNPEFFYAPQVWEFHPYGFSHAEWILRLREEGLYEVGGLGACTLLRRSVLEAGVRFAHVPGCPQWGEDRDFCVRAAVAGFPLFAHSGNAPFHLYRPSLLELLPKWQAGGQEWLRKNVLTKQWEREVLASFSPRGGGSSAASSSGAAKGSQEAVA